MAVTPCADAWAVRTKLPAGTLLQTIEAGEKPGRETIIGCGRFECGSGLIPSCQTALPVPMGFASAKKSTGKAEAEDVTQAKMRMVAGACSPTEFRGSHNLTDNWLVEPSVAGDAEVCA